MERKDLNIDFLLELLKEERSRRQSAENEVKLLQVMLEPLQQKELDRIRKAREDSLRNTRRNVNDVCGAASISPEMELGSYVRNKFPDGGRIECDCGECDKYVSYDFE